MLEITSCVGRKNLSGLDTAESKRLAYEIRIRMEQKC